MKFGLILLSDIHFSTNNNSLLDKLNALSNAINENMKNIDTIFLCVVGDTANTGMMDEYSIATDFLDEVKENLKSKNKTIHTIIVPGNHDCNFRGDQSIRDLVIKQVRENQNLDSSEYLNQIIKVQEDYKVFENYHLDSEEEFLVYDHALMKKYNYRVGQKNISFNLINSAWISTRKEEPGSMIIPTEHIKQYIPQNKSDLSISLVHHHLRWLHPDNARIFESFLTEHSDIVISGHEHSPTNYTKFSFTSSLYFMECGALQVGYEPDHSYFQTLKIDLDNNSYKRKEFNWDNNIKLYHTVNETGWESLNNILLKQSNSKIILNENYKNDLNDPGAPFQHPRKQQLTLQDIFIYPDLKEIIISDKKQSEKFIDMKELIVDDLSTSYLMIGNEKVGKTSLLKHLYIEFYTKGYFPLFLSGKDFKKTNEDNIQKKLEEAILQQYVGQHVVDQYNQIPIEQKIIFIDDWQKCPLNLTGKRKILNYFELSSSRIFLTTSDIQGARDLLISEQNKNKYRKFEISEFGHKKRAELIEQWLLLGTDELLQEQEIIQKKDWTEGQLRSLVSKGHVPSYPFFLLTILQTLESSNSHQMKDSTKGHYYDVLIGDALARMELKNRDIDIIKNYISHLAYYFFQKNDDKVISNHEFKKFHSTFNTKYELNLNFDIYADKLIRSSLLYREYDGFKFKYPYVYFYFVAKYLADNIESVKSQKKIKEHITTMSRNLFNDEYANILMFLIHLSKNEYILSQVLDSAQNSFSEINEISLEGEITAINELLKTVPKMVLEEKTRVSENRKIMHEQQDKIDRSLKEVDNEPTKSEEEFEFIEKINNINQGLKTIELIGQLLQNYPGYIEGANKRNLSDEAMKTGLRILNVFLHQVLTDKDYMLGESIYYLTSQKAINETEQEIEEKAKRFLFNFCSWITYSILKSISKSLGSKDTQEIIDKVILESPNVARRLIGISISLDHTYTIPHHEISKLYKQIEHNLLPSTILKRMVMQYLHLFEVPFDEKQRICSTVGINYKYQVSLDAQSKRQALKH